MGEKIRFEWKVWDSDGEVIRIRIDFDGDGELDWESWEKDKNSADFIYEKAGDYKARFRVIDNDDKEFVLDVDVKIEDKDANIGDEEKEGDDDEGFPGFEAILLILVAALSGFMGRCKKSRLERTSEKENYKKGKCNKGKPNWKCSNEK